jgi:ribosomal protein S18 acetylase RimI-like enzyme
MCAQLVDLPSFESNDMRCPVESDIPALAKLMLEAYLDTVDYEGEDEDDALVQVRKTVSGQSGPFNWQASRVIERQSVIACAVLVTRWQDKPFVAFTMTHPDFKRMGLARACMLSAMHSLATAGEKEIRLMVTLANTGAVALYRSLGFQMED